MTHRELLLWLEPRLERAGATGIDGEGVRAIRDELERMRKAGALRPFASRLYTLVRERSMLDAETVVGLAGELRCELSPPREQRMLLSTIQQRNEK
jgi:hypothetical protein